ncbi:DnaA ATPase domain-containing protein [Paenibacillus vini]|uniref:DnaA ATPase domain-containing protein n=1 Tax=Paenibacillus vini TaxID=1476024 RepID=UPI00338EAB24
MQDLLRRIEQMKEERRESEKLNQSQEKLPKKSIVSNDGCEKCEYTGTINTFKWIDSETLDKYGNPMKVQVATVEPCSCLKERQFQKYNAAASFSDKEKGYTFKNAVIDQDNEEAFRIAVQFIEDLEENLKSGKWLYIYGDDQRVEDDELSAFGTGKTYLMQCIANALSNRKIPAIYVTEEELFGDIKSTYNRDSDESETEVLNKYYFIPVLMIDDIFTAQYKDWAEGKLFSILDEREKNNKITIMTGNYALYRIHHRLPINGKKIASRIKGKCGEDGLIELIGPDRR